MTTATAEASAGERTPPAPTPDQIMQLGLGFWGSKALLSAVELGLFSELAASGPLDEALREQLARACPRRGSTERSSADVLCMGHILHVWDMDEKRALLVKAYAALPDGGALIVYESIIDDERRENAFGLRGLRLHRGRLPALDARRRLPRNLGTATHRTRRDGHRNQVGRRLWNSGAGQDSSDRRAR